MTLLTTAGACDRYSAAPTALRPGDAQFAKPAQLSDPTVALYLWNDASLAFKGDGLSAYIEPATSPFAGASRYLDGECGVTARVFALSGGSGDMVYNSAGTQDHKCAAYSRKMRLSFALIAADGTLSSEGDETVQSGGNVSEIERAANSGNTGFYIPIGTSALRGFHISDDTGKCSAVNGGGIAFRPVLVTGEFAGADDVTVRRDAADTWTVTSQADEIDPVSGQTIHHDKAYCRSIGKLYHMPVHFSIRTSRALTP
jgi:hypothetical protein